MSTKIKFEKDTDNVPAVSADVDHAAVNSEKEDNLNLGLVQQGSDVAEEMKLDDARRVKAVSPGLLVAKRFFRNKLALSGMSILIVLFLFCFLGAAVYPYSQSETFNTNKELRIDYAFARENSSNFKTYMIEGKEVGMILELKMNSHISKMKENKWTSMTVKDEDNGDHQYRLSKVNDDLYVLVNKDPVAVAQLQSAVSAGTYTNDKVALKLKLDEANAAVSAALQASWEESKKTNKVSATVDGNTYTLIAADNKSGTVMCAYGALVENTEAREDGVTDALVAEAQAHLGGTFEMGGETYNVTAYEDCANRGYNVTANISFVAMYASTLSIDRYDLTQEVPDEFKLAALGALAGFDKEDPATASFEYDGKQYTIVDEDGAFTISYKQGEQDVGYVYLCNVSIRRYTGEDTLSVATKEAYREVIEYMNTHALKTYTVNIKMEALDENGDYVYDENGVLQFADEEFYIVSEERGVGQQFVFRNMQTKLVADVNAAPSKEHVLGLDGNAMDVLARIMYGGRVSLLIGFIVVFIEIILGSIMGGISGYFGGVVDNIIMRIVDIFYCIPTMPILIILGAMFNTLKLENLTRVIYMMMVLGFLGWPGIARLVRGQILSLREQDFMIAAEASGLTAKRKIAKHLIPNVIPQLIVQATMGLGGVILTESTLSFLGLGVKFPMATWGQIINSVSSINAMQTYTYIWIPVGALICLAVIAFNFVGDGLRDAFDPRMSR